MLQGQVYVTDGDVITALDGVPVASVEDFLAALNKRQAGHYVTLTVLRSGRTMDVKATLAPRSSS
jgi:S1-C subfamily serine protease